MATIKEVARQARVSASTVSLALNRRVGVNPATQRRVQEAASSLGYKPQRVGRPARQPRSGAILVLHGRQSASTSRASLLGRQWSAGVREVVEAGRNRLSILAGAEHVEQDLMIKPLLAGGEVGGAILIGLTPADGYLEWLLGRQVPVVVMDGYAEHSEFSYVAIDEYGGGMTALRHLYDHGHRRVALVTWQGADTRGERRAGALAAADALGMQIVFDAAVSQAGEPHETAALCRQALAKDATAVYALDSKAARAWAAGCRAAEVDIPAELSLVCFGDVGAKTAAGQRFTAVAFDAHRMGAAAAEMLLHLAGNGEDTRNMSLTVRTFLAAYDTVATVGEAQESMPPRSTEEKCMV